MIQRVYERCREALDEVWVATDDQRIFDHVQNFGGMVAMTSEDHQSGTDRCAEMVNEQMKLADESVVINIQGDEPLIDPDQIRLLAGLFSEPHVQIGTLVRPIEDQNVYGDPNSPKVVLDKNGKALYFSRSAIPYHREKPGKAEGLKIYQHIGIYGYRVGTLRELAQLRVSMLEEAERLEQLRWLENGYQIHTKESNHLSMAVDRPEDLDKMLHRFANFLT